MKLCALPFLAAAVSSFSAAAPTSTPRQHVLFVVVDDLGFDDVGFRSGDIRTPHIDSLASQGVILDQYYAQDVCSPTRASFLSGRYALHHSIVDWIPPASPYGLPLNLTTMADVFKGAGYETRAVGKWHLGFYKWDYTPTFRGFDSFVGFYSGGEDYFTHQSSGGYDFRNDTSPRCGDNCSRIAWEAEGKYSTTVFAEEAVRLIDAYDVTKADTNPLFMYLAFQGVHAPAEAPQSYIDAYAKTIDDPKRRTFAGMLSCVDEGIGNVTAALQAKGMLENTVIVFTADNGGPTTTGDGVGARNWPMRGGKHSIWEGGVRVTGVLSGAPVAAHVMGKTYTGLMHAADWLPTLADAAGVSLPTNDSGLQNLDGVSQWAAITSIGNPDAGLWAPPPRSGLVIGNSTNYCTWSGLNQRIVESDPLTAGQVGCGFSIVKQQNQSLFKLIKGYGGGPDTWCNSTKGGADCVTPPPANFVSIQDSACTVAPGVCFPGDDIKHVPSNTTDGSDCCDVCMSTPDCKAWTHNQNAPSGPTCFIKASISQPETGASCISGMNGHAPLPPVPTPTPGRDNYCPNGWCLYDVRADPVEQFEVSAANEEVVASMQEDMATILQSYWEYSADPTCPPHKFPDPKKPVWGPWC